MNPLVTKALPYVIGVVLVFAGGWKITKTIQRTGELETLLAQQVDETLECVESNATNNTTITNLEKTITDMVEERRVDTARREQILVDREADILRWRARADELERERDNEIVNNEQCMEFTSLDPSRFCPESADQLRVRSRGQSGDGDTDGGSPGGSL